MSSEPLKAVTEPAASEAREVFVSFSSKDGDLARQVKAAVEQLGLRCWLFLNDQEAGSYSTHIAQAIDDCRVVVLILTEASNISVNVEREITLANELKRPIIPLWFDPDLKLSKALAFQLSNLQRAHSIADLELFLQPFRRHERTITPTPSVEIVVKPPPPDPWSKRVRWWAVLAIAVSVLGFLVVMSQVFCTPSAGDPALVHHPS